MLSLILLKPHAKPEFPLALSNGNYLSPLELKEVKEMEQKQMVERGWVMGRRNRK